MNTALRSQLDAEPVPTDAGGQMASACVIRLADGRWTLAWLVGTHKEPFGAGFGRVTDATEASRYLNEERGE